jgi:calcineurin-like phosphoesterase family protein
MTKSWVCADHHFGHANILNFKRDDGTSLRPFKSLEEHDETLIANHNSVVQPADRVYLLGDVCIKRQYLHLLYRLNGRKVLVKGNHDIFKLKDYLPYFDDIRAYVVQKDKNGNQVILSHVPIHPGSLKRFGVNIHGHLHYGRVKIGESEKIDTRYKCVSMEHIDYTPIEVYKALEL